MIHRKFCDTGHSDLMTCGEWRDWWRRANDPRFDCRGRDHEFEKAAPTATCERCGITYGELMG